MGAVEEDFNQRCSEIELFLEFLRGLEQSTGTDVTLMATMKASGLVMIYNLVESTTTNSIESIFDRLKSENIGFAQLDDKLKVVVLRCAKDVNPSELVKRMKDEVLDLAVAAFRKNSIFSGNVDSKRIRAVWDDYGIPRTSAYREGVLLEVKDARNDLSHGFKSFGELGRSLTVVDLDKKYRATRALLLQALQDVSSFVATRLVRVP